MAASRPVRAVSWFVDRFLLKSLEACPVCKPELVGVKLTRLVALPSVAPMQSEILKHVCLTLDSRIAVSGIFIVKERALMNSADLPRLLSRRSIEGQDRLHL